MIHFADKIEPNEQEYVACPVKKGSLVIIHGLVYHKSLPNTSKDSRWIYTFHMIDGTLEYPNDNWLLPTEAVPFTKLATE
jgi:phytanoyl-CoA hydroxylase